MKKIITTILLSVFSLSMAFAVTGKEVLDMVKDEHDDFDSQKSQITMKLIDANGNEKAREFDMFLLKENDDSLALVRFNTPAEVKMITLLTLSDDEIYIYMPAYRKTKRISGGAKNGNFVGSDLKYSDISLLYNEKSGDYTSNLLEDNSNFYKVEIIPEDEDTDYGRIVAIVEKENMLIKDVDFFNQKDEHIKTMSFTNLKDFEGHKLYSHIELTDLTSNHSTVLDIKKADFDIGITNRFFNKMNISKPVLRIQ
ncbi:outer membrane lipoprotein-sorting protein [Oceanotoga sp. DSM 15011]|uniref:outer membrane lipoprotein-sorting protein n=1 Tax=Oceanotoga sp. DSM 15011 TaxID=2984951 RepID=UPI0021F3D1C8|nr:outer membrane lipoprotein-sorting protein [Oceanotoga sp. DSM 15011]UYO98846.1 outer membrane lipoprotein-sorting protein [Oceanotoga sp. DSM 15011]